MNGFPQGCPQGPPQNAIGCGLQIVAGRAVVIVQLGGMQTALDANTAVVLGVQLIGNGTMAQQPPEVLRKLALEMESSIVLVGGKLDG